MLGMALPSTTLRARRPERPFSPADLLNVVRLRGAWRHRDGLSYGRGPRRKLDVYHPRTGTHAPVVVFFYGGAWQSGSRDMYRFVGASLASRGIVAVVPDYSLYPAARFPGFLEDAAHAVAFVREHAARWNGDASHLTLMGHSAGAHIAAMLAFDRQWLRDVDLDARKDVAGLIGLAGPYDFLPLHDKTLRTIFGGNRRETQPIDFVTGEEAPALLISPRRDHLVSPGNSRRLAAKIRAEGGAVEEIVYGTVGHLSLIGAFAPGLRFLAPVLRDVTDFAKAAANGAAR